jgi:hypothetical protein
MSSRVGSTARSVDCFPLARSYSSICLCRSVGIQNELRPYYPQAGDRGRRHADRQARYMNHVRIIVRDLARLSGLEVPRRG